MRQTDNLVVVAAMYVATCTALDSLTFYLLIIHYLLSPVSRKIIYAHTSIETRTSVLIIFPADP